MGNPEQQKPGDNPKKENVEGIVKRLSEALEANEETDSLENLGNLLYQEYKEESPEIVLSSIKDVFTKYEEQFEEKITFNDFIEAFGAGMIKLCQQKLVEKGYDLGKYGPEKDGVDGKLGKKTLSALDGYYNQKEPDKQPADTQPAPVETVESANKTPEFSSKEVLQAKIRAIYNKNQTLYFNGWNDGHQENLSDAFGKNEADVRRYLTPLDTSTKPPLAMDPLHPGQHLTFLGKPITYGINLKMVPFLMAAKEMIEKSGIDYTPKAPFIAGFEYRDAKENGKPSGHPSFHKVGLAIDIDGSDNTPKAANHRGTIPDHVVLALVNAGFAWGAGGNEDFPYLADDFMHAQLRFPPESPQGQAIINASPLAKAYWEAIRPMLPA